MRINIVALLPAPDGTGWYAVLPNDSHLCSATGCMRLAVAFHRSVLEGDEVSRNRYRCREHMDPNMVVRAGRVWVEQ